MSLGKNESSSFWLEVLTDLKARGVEDILITATDNQNGFTQTLLCDVKDKIYKMLLYF